METELVCDFCDNPVGEDEVGAQAERGLLVVCADCMGLAEQYTSKSV